MSNVEGVASAFKFPPSSADPLLADVTFAAIVRLEPDG